MRSAQSDDGSPGCLYTPRAPHLWFLTRPTPFTRWAVTSTLRMRYPVTPPEWGSSGLNTAMAFLFPLHYTHSAQGGECRQVWGVESGEGRFGVYPAPPPAASGPREVPSQCLLAVRASGFLAGGSSLPQSPACQAPCILRHEAGAQVGATS